MQNETKWRSLAYIVRNSEDLYYGSMEAENQGKYLAEVFVKGCSNICQHFVIRYFYHAILCLWI